MSVRLPPLGKVGALDWADNWRVPGTWQESDSGKAKTALNL